MSYCPNCGKKAADPYAKFCGYCQTDLKTLGVARSSVAEQQSFTPVMIHPNRTKRHLSAAEKIRNDRMKQEPGQSSDIDMEDEAGSVNVQHFDRSRFTGLDVEISVIKNNSERAEKLFLPI